MSYMGAINGLLINSDHINILSNNIANASTIGFKSSTPAFYNIVPHPLYSHNTAGSGVGIAKNIQNFNDGMLIETGRDLDLRIINEGFFRVLDAKGHVHYTRNGQFLIDENKNLINMQGMYVTGRNKSYLKNNLNNAYKSEPINLKHADILQAKPTSAITLIAILNSNNTNLSPNISDKDLSKKSDYTTNIKIYKKDETTEDLSISFNKTDKNTWKVSIQSSDLNKNNINKNIDNTFDLKFNANGQLTSDPKFVIKYQNKQYENITLNLANTTEQSDTNNSLEQAFQNGYSKGSLKTFEILPNGEIIGTYSNQERQEIGQILLSKFINPETLQPESGNVWFATQDTGKENIGMPGNAGFGLLSTKNLEGSNVDLNKELINMIVAQRNYQSNAQAFKAEDKAINTLINLR